MKTGRIKTLFIIIALVYYTTKVSIRSILKYYLGTPTRPWADKYIHVWADELINAAQIQYEVINPHNTQPEPGRAIILMCNHSSVYDIPLSFKAFPNHSIRMLAKKELSRVPILSKGMTAAGFLFVDRKNRYQAIKDLAKARELMESGIIMWIAPEGTRSKDGKLAPFKKGGFITAIQAKALIIPMGIRGAFEVVPAHKLQINLGQKVELHLGKPIDAARFTQDNKDELIKKTYDAMKKLVGE